MNTEQQNLAWACLPKEVRDEIRKEYGNSIVSAQAYTISSWQTLKWLYGKHNLTSDTEPSELLYVEREKVQDAYKAITSDMRRAVLEELFGEKCLPDKDYNKRH